MRCGKPWCLCPAAWGGVCPHLPLCLLFTCPEDVGLSSDRCSACAGTSSTIFSDIIEPYSKKLAAWLHNSSRKPIANCKPLTGNGTMDMPSPLAPAPAPDAFTPLLGGAPAPGALPGAIIAPINAPAVAPIAAPVDVARTPISAPVNLTPGTLVNAEPGNPIVASAGAPIAAPAKIAAQPAGLGVPVVAPGGVPVVNAPVGTPIIPVQSAVVPGTITAGDLRLPFNRAKCCSGFPSSVSLHVQSHRGCATPTSDHQMSNPTRLHLIVPGSF